MSDLDDRLIEGRSVVGTMAPPDDLWSRVVDRVDHADAAVLDLDLASHRRRPSLWLAVAAAVALLAVVGVWALQDDDATIDTVPATGGETTTTNEPRLIAFAVPLSFDLPTGWTVDERDLSFWRYGIGPVRDLPETRIDFAVPEAATLEAAVADLAATAPAGVLGDPFDALLGNLSATCLDVVAPAGTGATPLIQTRANQHESSVPVTLREGAAGRVCLANAWTQKPDEPRVPIVVLIQAPSAELDGFLGEAERLLEDIDFS